MTAAPTAQTAQNVKAPNARSVPNWGNELELWADGYTLITGVDEAGRGAWAGPLVAGAVILPHPGALAAPDMAWVSAEISRLRDSKMLTAHVREELLTAVQRVAVATGVGIVSPGLIDVIGLGAANRLAMGRAVRDLGIWPEVLLIDAFKLPSMPLPQRPIIKGDATCMSIAAASIIAKVARDHMMHEHEETHPGYSFARHKGYGTRLHVEAILSLGVCPLHRRSYAPIKAILAGQPWPPITEESIEDPGDQGAD